MNDILLLVSGLAGVAACGVPVAVYHPRVDDRPSLAGDPRPGVRVRDLPAQRTAWEVAA